MPVEAFINRSLDDATTDQSSSDRTEYFILTHLPEAKSYSAEETPLANRNLADGDPYSCKGAPQNEFDLSMLSETAPTDFESFSLKNLFGNRNNDLMSEENSDNEASVVSDASGPPLVRNTQERKSSQKEEFFSDVVVDEGDAFFNVKKNICSLERQLIDMICRLRDSLLSRRTGDYETDTKGSLLYSELNGCEYNFENIVPSKELLRRRHQHLDQLYHAYSNLPLKCQLTNLLTNHPGVDEATGSSSLSSLTAFFEQNILGPVLEQRDYLAFCLKERKNESQALLDQLDLCYSNLEKRKADLEAHNQLTLLRDLLEEKEAECCRLDAEKQSLAFLLTGQIKEKVAKEYRRADKMRDNGLSIIGEEAARLSEETDFDPSLLKVRSVFLESIRDNLEGLWGASIQIPKDRESSSAIKLARRTTRGGVSGAVEESGWSCIRSSRWQACWEALPLFSFYGGATKENLTGHPLHTFLKDLARTQHEAFAREEMLIHSLNSEARTSQVEIEGPFSFSWHHLSPKIMGLRKTSIASMFLRQLESGKYLQQIYDSWRTEAEALFAHHCYLLEFLLFHCAPPGDRAAQVKENCFVEKIQLEWYSPQNSFSSGPVEHQLHLGSSFASLSQFSDDSRSKKLGLSSSLASSRCANRYLLRCSLPPLNQRKKYPVLQKGVVNTSSTDNNALVSKKSIEDGGPELEASISLYTCKVDYNARVAMNTTLREKIEREKRALRSGYPSPSISQFLSPRTSPSCSLNATMRSAASEGLDDDDEHVVRHFIANGLVQCAVTFSDEAAKYRKEEKAEALKALREQRELEEELAEILEENFHLERKLEELIGNLGLEEALVEELFMEVDAV